MIEQLNQQAAVESTDLSHGKNVKGATESGSHGCLSAILAGLHEGENGLHPHTARHVPAFVPLLHIANEIIGLISTLSTKR